jgi:uncharacterized membrane protein
MAHDHHGSGGAEAAGAAAWLIAMVIFVVIAVALIVALFVWAPWTTETQPAAPPGAEEQAPGAGEGNGAATD